MAHVLLQLDQGYICSARYNSTKPWQNWKGHVLGPEDEESKIRTYVAHVTRLEFQDGKRKLPTQDYHGSESKLRSDTTAAAPHTATP